MLAGRKRQNDSKWITEVYQGSVDTSHEIHNYATDLLPFLLFEQVK